MVDIFVSYSKKDAQHARTLSEHLESKGWDVFWDHEIPPGSNWVEFIGQNLDHSKLVVVLWSENSIKSKWVRREASIALDKENLLPVRLQDVIPPNIFSSIQSASLLGWDGVSITPQLNQLVEVIAKNIGKPQSDATYVSEHPTSKPQEMPDLKTPQKPSPQPTQKQQAPQPDLPKKSNTGLLLALVGLAVLAIGGWFGFNQMQQQDSKKLLQVERKYWVEIEESTQPQVFKDYLSKYGDKPGTFRTEAKSKYDSLIAESDKADLLEKEEDYWDLVSTGDKIKGYNKYLNRYGDDPGTYREQAKARIVELDKVEAGESLKIAERDYWDATKNTNNIEEIQAYLDQYGAEPGSFTEQAKARIVELEKVAAGESLKIAEQEYWDAIKTTENIDELQAYIDQYGTEPGSFTEQAKNKIDSLNRQLSRQERLASEKIYWNQIKTSEKPEDFKKYLEKYELDPATYTAAAKERIEQLSSELDQKKRLSEEKATWAKIQASTDPNDFKYFIREYGKDPGTYTDKARRIYAELTKPVEPVRVKIDFVNNSDVPVVIYRLDVAGKEGVAKTLQRGESGVVESSPGEKWVVRDRRTREKLVEFTSIKKRLIIDIPMPSLNGRTVNMVQYGDGGKVAGVFKLNTGKNWQEISRASGRTFNFQETSRDQWSVYLFDASRRIKIQLDLYKRIIYYSDANVQKREKYKIIKASKSSPVMFQQVN